MNQMSQWLSENLVVILLAAFSGVGLAKRALGAVAAALSVTGSSPLPPDVETPVAPQIPRVARIYQTRDFHFQSDPSDRRTSEAILDDQASG